MNNSGDNMEDFTDDNIESDTNENHLYSDDEFSTEPDDMLKKNYGISAQSVDNMQGKTISDIEKKVEELKALCQYLRHPMFVTVASGIVDSDGHEKYISDAVTPKDLSIKSDTDYVTSCMLIMNGFKVTSSEPLILDFD